MCGLDWASQSWWRTLGAACCAWGCLLTSLQAQAPLDLSRLTCQELQQRGPDDVAAILLWLDGYWAGQSGGTTVDFGAVGVVARDLDRYCHQHPQAKIMEVMKQLWGKAR